MIVELAAKLGISVNKLRQYNNEVANSVTFSFEELIQNVNQMGSVLETASTDGLTPKMLYKKRTQTAA